MPDRSVFSVERDEHVAIVFLDNPERRNAMGPAFWSELPIVIGEISDDDSVRAVVIVATGRDFSVGLDLKSMGGDARRVGESGSTQRTRSYRDIKRLQAAITAVAECPKPVVAAIHGWCIGGGVDLATACDIRLASADARFSVRETKVAITADVGTLQRLPKVLSAGHVAELVYTGKDVDADRALAIGLVNSVHPDAAAVLDAARGLAQAVAANSPIAVQGSKAVLRAGDSMTVDQALDYVALWNTAFIHSNDLVEAMTAFVEKRPPRFTGQ